jgi:hypothetical protein
MKKLYRVEVVCEVAVVAESAEQAEELLAENRYDWRGELESAEYSAREVTNMNQMDDWRGSYPYGDDGSHHCESYVEASKTEDGVKA